MIVTSVQFENATQKLRQDGLSIARSLERVGAWWSILIIRDALLGFTRFDEFQKSLKIAPNMLTRRLSALLDAGLLQRRCSSSSLRQERLLLLPMQRCTRQFVMMSNCNPPGFSISLFMRLVA